MLNTKNTTIYTLLTALMMLVTVEIFSQPAKKGFQLLQQKKYSEALISFKKSIGKSKDLIASKFGAASVYANPNYKKYNYKRAYKYILYVDNKYVKLSDKPMQELNKKYGINDISINTLKRKILNNAFEQAKNENTIESYNDFCLDFPNTEQSRKAVLCQQSLAFQQAKMANNLHEFQDFIKKYPTAKQSDSAKLLIQNIENQVFHDYTHEGELDMIEEFEKQYPNFAQKDSLQKLKQLANMAFKLNLDEKYIQNMESYYFDYIKKAAPAELAYVALLRTLTPYLNQKNWQKAIQIIKNNKPYFKNDTRLDTLIAILKNPDEEVELRSVSKVINSQGHEYAPVITPDGRTMYFCGRKRHDNIGGEDIFVTKFKNGEWTPPSILKSINTPYSHEAPLAISADGNMMLLYANNDIYYSEKLGDKWSMPRRFPAINHEKSWEADAMITADGKAVFFISDRTGNIGGHHEFGKLFHGAHSGNSDIYVSWVDENGNWSKPINLGTTINTPYSERSPFLHPDMKTLYFSSDGHAGLGKLDVFKSERLNDSSWTEWSEPVNLGKAINSTSGDYDYKISTDGKLAFLSSIKSGSYDIYQIKLPEKAKPQNVATVSGFIKNENGTPIHAKVKWENMETGKIIGSLHSNAKDGSYTIILPLKKNYGYYIEHENYYPLSGNIDLRKVDETTKIRKDFTMYTYTEIITKKIAIPLENVFFETNKYNLKSESFAELDRLIRFLNKNKNITIEIGGHTDNSGSKEHNKKLSLQRAKSVEAYLVKRGVSAKRILSKGYGETKPVAPNTNEDGKARNRRVEFRVVEKK